MRRRNAFIRAEQAAVESGSLTPGHETEWPTVLFDVFQHDKTLHAVIIAPWAPNRQHLARACVTMPEENIGRGIHRSKRKLELATRHVAVHMQWAKSS